MPDRGNVCPDIFAVQTSSRVPQPTRAAWIVVGTPGTHCRAGPLRTLAPEVQPIRNLIERAMQAELGDERSVREVVATQQRHTAQDLRSDHGTAVVAPAVEQHASEAVR